MKRKWVVIGISTVAVILIILTALTNVVGYHTVQSSNQKRMSNIVNQRELLIQTICEIANNNDIQRIILKSQMSRGIFPVSDIPVVTKNYLKQMYFIGLLLSKVISKSKIYPIIKQYQVSSQEMQKEISAVIEKDATLNAKITQLRNSECECENATSSYWEFPVLCALLFPIYIVSFICLLLLADLSDEFNFQKHPVCLYILLLIFFIYAITAIISTVLNCFFIFTPLEGDQ